MIALALMMAASSQFITGQSLSDDCAALGAARQAHCIGFITGVSDTLAYMEADAPLLCIPAQIEAGRLREVVTRYLAAHPALLDLSASSLAAKPHTCALPSVPRAIATNRQ
jgi:hypothetical protein